MPDTTLWIAACAGTTEKRRRYQVCFVAVALFFCLSATVLAQTPNGESSSSAARKHVSTHVNAELDKGTVENGVYRNKALGMTCNIPAGWVQRTDEMNAPATEGEAQPSTAGSSVLLAVLSRPPAARGEDVNSSIIIAAESAAAYSGLKEAVQYSDLLEEAAKSQGFTTDEEPYETTIGGKSLVREDFHKNIGSRVMHQSTLALMSHGYAVSITIVGGTADEVEELLENIQFQPASPRAGPHK